MQRARIVAAVAAVTAAAFCAVACRPSSPPSPSPASAEPVACEPAYLSSGDPCAVSGQTCATSSGTCDCDGKVWHCRSSDCPSEFPASGSCQSWAQCDYGGGRACECSFPDAAWLCCDGSTLHCPAAAPVEGAACCGGIAPRELPCGYRCGEAASVTCSCDYNHWHCQAARCGF